MSQTVTEWKVGGWKTVSQKALLSEFIVFKVSNNRDINMYIFFIFLTPTRRTKKPAWISASTKVSFRVSVRSKRFPIVLKRYLSSPVNYLRKLLKYSSFQHTVLSETRVYSDSSTKAISLKGLNTK